MEQIETPRRLGYRLPAEWEPHAATWLAWPRNPQTWPGCFEGIPSVWAELVRALAASEPVHVLAGSAEVTRQARAMVGGLANVSLHDVPTDDAWIRDHGPMFLTRPPAARPALVDWKYNAWGGKYPPFDLDNDVPRQVARITGARRFTPNITLEGGAIDSNGRGTLLAARSSLVDPARNPGLTVEDIERALGDFLGARKILWLDGSLAGDDTDGHVDQIARFVGPTTVVAAHESDTSDDNYDVLQANQERLQQMTDERGRPLEVIPLPMPAPLFRDGSRLPASYVNFYIANRLIVIPHFNDPADRQAQRILADLFPGRQVVGLPAADLVVGLGAYHCVTQQQPHQS